MGGTREPKFTGIKLVLPGYQKFRGTMGGTQVSKFPRTVDFDVDEDEDEWVTPQWQPGYQNVTGPNGWYPGIKISLYQMGGTRVSKFSQKIKKLT